MLKSNYCRSAALFALLTSTSILPVAAQETPAAEEVVSTDGSAAPTAGIEQINQELETLTAELMRSLSRTGTYAVKSANDTTAGVPEDLLTQMTSSLQSSLMLASDFQITLIDQAQIQDAWSNAVEFNGADFEKLVENASFDALIVLNTRATTNGIEISLQAIGATGENSGQVIASSKTASLGVDWNSMAGVDIGGIDDKIAALDTKITQSIPTEVKSESKASVEYKKYVDATECIRGVSEPHGCFDSYYGENDRIVAIVDGKRLIADPGIDGSKYVTDLGMDAEWNFNNSIVWQGDFDNDGYSDVVIGSECGGSGCPPIYRIVLYKGNGKFSTLHLKNLEARDDPEVVPEGYHFVLKLSGQDGSQESTSRASLVDLEYRVTNGELVETNAGAASNQFNLAEFNVDEAIAADTNMACSMDENSPCVSWQFDLTGDGHQETISCGYWARWQVLNNCEIKNPDNGKVYGLFVNYEPGKMPAQCKTIFVLDESESGLQKLSCDFDAVLIEPITGGVSKFFSAQTEFFESSVQSRSEARKTILEFGPMHNSEQRAMLQEILANWDLYEGAYDGDWGPATELALEKFFDAVHASGISYSLSSPNDFVALVNGMMAPEYAQFFKVEQVKLDVSGFEGRYAFTGSCGTESDSGLMVTASAYEFYESSCQILSASDQGNGRQDVALSCAGEGEEWQRAISVYKDDAGDLFIEEDGNRYHYQACR